MSANNITIIGYSGVGKTVFLSQLYGRIKEGKNRIKPIGKPNSIPIQNAIKNLVKGNSPETTPAQKYDKLILPINIKGQNVELVCPEYGGEQIQNMVNQRKFDENWIESVSRSDYWLFFIRLKDINENNNVINKFNNRKEAIEKDNKFIVSDQTQYIELLQFLLFLKNKGIRNIVKEPKLLIVLTCWDELNVPINTQPNSIFEKKLHLMNNFIYTIWDSNSVKVMGLSAQEFSLDSDENKEMYLDNSPEDFGYVILENGERNDDLTLLIESIF